MFGTFDWRQDANVTRDLGHSPGILSLSQFNWIPYGGRHCGNVSQLYLWSVVPVLCYPYHIGALMM